MATPISLLLTNNHVTGNILADGDAVEVVHAGVSGASTMADLIVKMTGPNPAGTNKRIYGGAGTADRLLLDTSSAAQPPLWSATHGQYNVGDQVTFGYGRNNQLLGVFVCTGTHTASAFSVPPNPVPPNYVGTGPPGSYQAQWVALSSGIGMFGAVNETFRIDSTGKVAIGDNVGNETHNMVTITRGTPSPHATTGLGTGVSIMGGDDDVNAGNSLGGLQVSWRIWKTGAQNPNATEANALAMVLFNEDPLYTGNIGGFGGPRTFHYVNVIGANQPTLFACNPEVKVGNTDANGIPDPAFGGIVGANKPSINCLEVGASDWSAAPGANPGFAIRPQCNGIWDTTTAQYLGTEFNWGGFNNGYVINTNRRKVPTTNWASGGGYKIGQPVKGTDGLGYICNRNTQTQPSVAPPANTADWDPINPSTGPRFWHFFVGPCGAPTPPTNGIPNGQSSPANPQGTGAQNNPTQVDFAVYNGGRTIIGDYLEIGGNLPSRSGAPGGTPWGKGRLWVQNGHLWYTGMTDAGVVVAAQQLST